MPKGQQPIGEFMTGVDGRSGFLSLLFILRDTTIQKIVEGMYNVGDMNEHRIGNITFCLSAREGVDEFEFNFPDIVFVQTELLDGSGYDVLDQIQASNPKSYVVMIGSDSSVENIQKSLRKGAKGFVVMPFSPNSVNEYVMRYFKEYFSENSSGYTDQGRV